MWLRKRYPKVVSSRRRSKEIVDRTIEHYREGAVLRNRRLAARFAQIENGKSAMAQYRLIPALDSFTVRAMAG